MSARDLSDVNGWMAEGIDYFPFAGGAPMEPHDRDYAEGGLIAMADGGWLEPVERDPFAD
jgi:hypothetical protein